MRGLVLFLTFLVGLTMLSCTSRSKEYQLRKESKKDVMQEIVDTSYHTHEHQIIDKRMCIVYAHVTLDDNRKDIRYNLCVNGIVQKNIYTFHSTMNSWPGEEYTIEEYLLIRYKENNPIPFKLD